MRRIRTVVAVLVAAAGLVALPAVPAWAAVTVSSFTPASGPVGTTVTVTGSGFTGSGTTCSSMTIAFNGTVGPCVYVSATTIKTTVPAGATTGPLTVNGVSAASPTFTVTLGITVAPAVARPGATVIITGSAFDPYTAVDVYFDTQDLALVSADVNGNFSGVSVTVPSSAAPGTHWVSVVERGSSGKSAQKSIRVATSWNQSGFSTTHTGANPYENQLSPSAVPNLNEDWATPTGGFIDRSTPAVAGNVGPHGVVYVGQSSGPSQFLAIDAQTGAKLWASTTTASQWGSPAVSGNRVFVTENGGNYLDAFSTTCLTTSCARVAQSSSTYYAFGAPTVSGGVVYTADRQHALDAFPATCTGTCTATWTGDDNGLLTGYPNQSTAGSVAVSASGWVFVIAGGSATPYTPVVLAAYSTASCSSGSCAPAWFASLQDAVNPHVTVANGIVYVDTGNQIYAFRVGGCGTSTSSCSPMWQVQVGTDYSTPAIYQGVLYTMVNNGAGVWDLAALNAATGTMLWTSPNLHGATDESVPAIADGVVYVNANDGSTFGELWAFPTAGCSGTCNPLWHAVVSATGYSSSPVIVNGTVYDASGDGSLYAYDLNPPAGTLRPRPSQLHPTLGS